MAIEWREMLVGEIAANVRNALVGGPFGSNLVSRDYVGNGIPVIRGQNMGSRWVTGEFAYVTPEKAKSLEANLARPKDIVFTQRGTLGQVALVPDSPFASYVVSQSQMKLTVDPQRADPLFFYYVFCSPAQQEYIRQHAIQTGVPHTNLGILRDTLVPVPLIDEQRAIAYILGTLDDKIELNRRVNETLEAIARAIFKSWFVDFDPVRAKASGESNESICRRLGLTPELLPLFPDRFQGSELGEVPAEWEVRPIGEVVQVVGGSTPNTKVPDYWVDGSFYWATPKDLSSLTAPVLIETERKISKLGLNQISSGLLPPGTLLMSSRAPIGYLAISAIPVAVNQGFIAIKGEDPISPHYLLNWAHFNMDTIKQHAGGTTFAEISKSSFRPLPIVLPKPSVLRSFSNIVQPYYDLIEQRLRESKSLIETREALLPKLLSGEIRVPSLQE